MMGLENLEHEVSNLSNRVKEVEELCRETRTLQLEILRAVRALQRQEKPLRWFGSLFRPSEA